MTLRRSVVCVALLALAVSTSTSAGVATKPHVILDVHAYAAAGSRVVFEGDVGPKNSGYYVPGSEGLWSEKFGSHKPKLLASSISDFCINDASWEIMSVALGPKGTVGCLTMGGGISSSGVDLYVVLGNGKKKHLVSRGYNSGAEDGVGANDQGLVPALFGDGRFLGFLEVSGTDLKLFRITPSGKAQYVADLGGVSSCFGTSTAFNCGGAAVDNGHIVIQEAGGDYVHVFTTAGKPVATFSANPSDTGDSVAIRKNRIVVLTKAKQLAVYTLQGVLVHSYPVNAGMGPITTYYGYAAYIGASRTAVHVLQLSTGKDRVIVRHLNDPCLSLQAPGLAVSSSKMLYVPMKTLRAKLG